jgi:protein O-mannosyl-transferase
MASVHLKKADLCLAIVLFIATFLAYWPCLHGGLVWDDAAHVTKPELQSARGLGRIWFDIGATQQYYPVLHSAFWLEHHLWGDSTFGYHVLNVALHSTAACLFALILYQLSINGAWIGAFIFALHPVCVESVAWITEQKNTLSAVFYLLAALLYLKNDERTQDGASRFAPAYFVSLACFIAAILSKSVTATLPAALLVILWWKRGRLSWNRDILPLIPWFAAGIGGGLFTAWVERRYIGAEGQDFSLSAMQRMLVAGRVVWFYLQKLVWPSKLVFIYPRWDVSPSIWWQYLFPAAAIALAVAAWLVRDRSRGPLAAFLFFAGSLFPALGFVNVYPFIFSFVADHFQYVASLGLITLAAGLCRSMASKTAAIAIAGILGILTWRDCAKYRDAITLYRTTIQQNPNCWMCYNNLGVIRLSEDRLAEAKQNFEDAIRIRPNYGEALFNLGNVLVSLDRPQEAMPYFQKAVQSTSDHGEAMLKMGISLLKMNRVADAVANIREVTKLRPNDAEAHRLLAVALRGFGQEMETRIELEQALRLNPDSPLLHRELAETMSGLGQSDEAISQLEVALRIDPQYADAHQALANLYAAKGRAAEATAHYKAAAARYSEILELTPDQAMVHNNLAIVLEGLKRPQDAEAHFRQAIRLKADYADAHYNLGLLLIALGRRADAIAEFKSSLRFDPNHAEYHDALGAALFQAERFTEAVSEFTEAERLKPNLPGVEGNLELARRAVASQQH